MKMITTTEVDNSSCLKCSSVNHQMFKVGAMVFCNTCHKTEFEYDNEDYTQSKMIDPETELGKHYYKWLELYKNQ